MGDLTRNFSRSEFICKCGKWCRGDEETTLRLARELQKFRDKIGQIDIISGFRCEAHNRSVGGVSSSRHTSPGDAADLAVQVPLWLAVWTLERLGWPGGVGVGEWAKKPFTSHAPYKLHVDLGPKRFWIYT